MTSVTKSIDKQIQLYKKKEKKKLQLREEKVQWEIQTNETKETQHKYCSVYGYMCVTATARQPN